MKTSKRNRGLSFLLALIMLVGMLPISVLSVSDESGGENAVGAPRGGSAGLCVGVSRADQFGRGNGDTLRLRLFFSIKTAG